MICADFESILLPEDIGKQNPEDYFTNKFQKHVTCSYGYKLVCADDKFSRSFKSYFSEDAVYNFINCLIKESKYFTFIKKHFNNSLVRTKGDFKNSTKRWTYRYNRYNI